jgi:drug/metabolite transporter (DMT)-like permease
MTVAESPTGLTAEGTHLGAFRRDDWVLLAVPSVVWGASFILIEEGLDGGLRPAAVTWLRIVLGFLAVSLVPQARGSIRREHRRQAVMVSITWLAFPMTLFPMAQQHVSPSVAGMLNGGIPVFAALVTTVMLRRVPGRWQLAGIAVGVIGVICIGAPTAGEGASSAWGVAMIVVAICSYGVAIPLNVPLAQRYGALVLFRFALGVSAVLTLPLALVDIGGNSLSGRAALAMLLLGVGGTALAFVCMSALSGRVGGTRAAVITYVEAVIALGLGVWWSDDSVGALQLVGCAALLGGAWLASRAERR